jgi:hypothetical protein
LGVLSAGIFWLVQLSALLVFTIPFRRQYVGLWSRRISPARAG